MQLEVRVPKESVALGHTPGPAVVEVDVASLTEADRKLLADWLDQDGDKYTLTGRRIGILTLPVAEPTAGAVLDACRGAAAELAQRQEEQAAAFRRHVDDELASMPENAGSDVYGVFNWGLYPEYRLEDRKAFAARIAEWNRAAPQRAIAAAQAYLDLRLAGEGGVPPNWGHYRTNVPEAKALVDKADQIMEERAAARKREILAARDQWLAEHGGQLTLKKIAKGYGCEGEIKRLVRQAAIAELIPELAGIEGFPGFAERDAECGKVKDRTSPSDLAFAVAEAINAVAGYSAEVKWGVWEWDESGPSDDLRQDELVLVQVACPWDPEDSSYLTIETVPLGD